MRRKLFWAPELFPPPERLQCACGPPGGRVRVQPSGVVSSSRPTRRWAAGRGFQPFARMGHILVAGKPARWSRSRTGRRGGVRKQIADETASPLWPRRRSILSQRCRGGAVTSCGGQPGLEGCASAGMIRSNASMCQAFLGAHGPWPVWDPRVRIKTGSVLNSVYLIRPMRFSDTVRRRSPPGEPYGQMIAGGNPFPTALPPIPKLRMPKESAWLQPPRSERNLVFRVFRSTRWSDSTAFVL